MKFIRFLLRYLVIGLLIGLGIVLVDQIYFTYGNPQQVVVMERLMEDLVDSQSGLIDIAELDNPPGLSFTAFGEHVNFEEACDVRVSQWPSIRCDDYPHFTVLRLSARPENLEAQLINLARIAVDDTFRGEKIGQFRVIQYSPDSKKMSSVLNEGRETPAPEEGGTAVYMGDGPPSYSAQICSKSECLNIYSGSRTKVAGLLAQILQDEQTEDKSGHPPIRETLRTNLDRTIWTSMLQRIWPVEQLAPAIGPRFGHRSGGFQRISSQLHRIRPIPSTRSMARRPFVLI